MSDSSTGGGTTDDEEWPVTSDWLRQMLTEYHRGADGLEVTDFKLSQAESALSDILFVSVSYRPPGESQVVDRDLVLKLLPRDPFSRFFVSEAQFDLREIKFYTKVTSPQLTGK